MNKLKTNIHEIFLKFLCTLCEFLEVISIKRKSEKLYKNSIEILENHIRIFRNSFEIFKERF